MEKIFYDEQEATMFVEQIRWGNGKPVCPHCKNEGAYRLKAKPTSKKGVRAGVLKCKRCRKQFSVRVGTIFEDSHIPLHKWLQAIHLFCSSKKGVSSHQIHRELEITYKSAWFITHRIRHSIKLEPLKSLLCGDVEVDETYIGGKSRGKRGRGAKNKTPVMALVQRDGKLKSKVVNRVSGKELKSAIRENVAKNSTIITDEWHSYKGIDKEYAGGHKVVITG